VRALRLMTATAAAAVLTVFAILGMVHLVETIAPVRLPSPIAVSERLIDFGKVPLNGTESREILVRNDSDGPIHAQFLVQGSTYEVEPEELILHPGVEWSVTVVARPDRPGRIDDVLRIQVVGGRISAVVIPLAGEVGSRAPDSEREMNSV
jgi:hypothetical protein